MITRLSRIVGNIALSSLCAVIKPRFLYLLAVFIIRLEVMKIKKLFHRSVSLLLAVLLAVALPVTSFAQATPSEASYMATSSNAVYDDFMESMDDFYSVDIPMLMSDGDGDVDSVSNGTVSDYSQLYVQFDYYDSSNTRRKYRKYCDSNGYFSIPVLDDAVRNNVIDFFVPSRALPPSGTYLVQLHFSSNTGGFTYSSNSSAFVGKDIRNAESVGLNALYDSFSQSSGDFTASKVVNLSGANYLFFRVVPSQDLKLPYGGYITWSFKPTNSSSALTTPTTGNVSNDSGSVSSSEIADNTAAIVEGQETIIETIREQIQYIIMQISSFWDQLAGEFTNLYNKMNSHHQEDLEKVDEQIENDNANTDKVTGAIEKHGNFIIEGLKSLFIPSDEYFKNYFDDLYNWFSDRFGFLSFPIDLLVELVDLFLNSSEVDCVLTLPSFSIMENQLWPDMSFNLTEFLNTNFSFLLVAIRTVSSIYLIMAFVHLCETKWNEVMRN